MSLSEYIGVYFSVTAMNNIWIIIIISRYISFWFLFSSCCLIIPSFINIPENHIMSFSSVRVMFHCVHRSLFLYPFISPSICLFPLFGCCKVQSSACLVAHVFQNVFFSSIECQFIPQVTFHRTSSFSFEKNLFLLLLF